MDSTSLPCRLVDDGLALLRMVLSNTWLGKPLLSFDHLVLECVTGSLGELTSSLTLSIREEILALLRPICERVRLVRFFPHASGELLLFVGLTLNECLTGTLLCQILYEKATMRSFIILSRLAILTHFGS